LGQSLLGDGVDPLHVSEEMDDVLGPRQQRQIALEDGALETVLYKGQQAAAQLAKGFQRSSPDACFDTKIIGQRTGGIQQGCAGKDFHELKGWQKAHQLTLAVYQITTSFPREELSG
jgi:hypothetical protein